MTYFSIIIPIYNVEKYLEECIQSILRQTFKEYEIILVDDGSTDRSSQICDNYVQKEEKISVIHKKNGGAASARNAGIKAAIGDFLVFIDSDDYFADNYFLQSVYHVLEEGAAQKKDIDVIVYGSIKYWEDNRHIIPQKRYEGLAKINSLSRAEALNCMVEENRFAVSANLHAVRRSFITERQIYFDETLQNAEDIEWTFHLMSKCPHIYGMNSLPYRYRVRKNSLCTSKRRSGFCKYRFQAITQSLKYISMCDEEISYRNALYAGLVYHYYLLLAEIPDEPNRNIRKDNFRKIQSYEMLQNYAIGKKEKLCRFVVKCFGVKCGAYILNYRVRSRRKRTVQ